MAIVPAPIVTAPEPRGLRYGLLTAANGPIDLPSPHGRGGGVRYDPVSCGFARLYPVECPADVVPVEKMFDDADSIITAEPFVAYATYVCGAAGYSAAELEAKVARRLANGEQTIAESAMATVLAAGAVGLAAPDPTSIESVVGELEQWLYGINGAAYGNVGYLHAPVRFEPYASFFGLIQKDGALLRTHMGTIWVFGGGYPDDDTIYISGQVTVWRSPDVVIPPALQGFDRQLNQYNLLAERDYAVAYDCVAASAEFVPAVAIS